jgi:hypothetical protein
MSNVARARSAPDGLERKGAYLQGVAGAAGFALKLYQIYNHFFMSPQRFNAMAWRRNLMEQHGIGQIYTHRINGGDTIISVSENWKIFAEKNNGAISCVPESIVGTSLWNHIRDPETKSLYELILQKVRDSKQPATFPFRCDAPAQRRFLNLSVSPVGQGCVDFESQIVKTVTRVLVDWLSLDTKRSDEFVKICSMCKKIAISEYTWVEIEIAMQQMRLFEKEMLPNFTHGVCESCYYKAMAELQKLG